MNQMPCSRGPGGRRLSVRTACVLFIVASWSVSPSQGSAYTTFRDDGLLLVDGEPFFPLGLLDLGARKYADWNDQIRQSGVNTIWDYEVAFADTVPTCRAVMDSARSTGYRLLIGSGDTINWDDPATPELEISTPLYEADALDALLDCAGPEPNQILGYTNRDEPVWTASQGWLGNIDAEHVHATYEQIHRRIPGTFLAMNFAPVHVSRDFDTWQSDIAPFLPATDVVMHAAYPYPAGPGTCQAANVLGWPECSLDRLADNADLFRLEMNGPGQPLWMVLQAFKAIPKKEARWAAWASVVHRATGIFWAGWTWEHPRGNGIDIWPHMKEVTRELGELQDFLVGRDVGPAFAVDPDVDVRALERLDGDEIIVVAISRRGFKGVTEVTLPLAAASHADVHNESRSLAIEDGRVVDHFEPYEAHVYRYARLGGQDARPTQALSVRSYPNPSVGSVRAVLELPRELSVTVRVHDATGRVVALAGEGRFSAGVSEVRWNGQDASGRAVASGVYFLRAMTSDGAVATSRVVYRAGTR